MADTNPINPVNPQAIKSYQALGKAIGTTGTAAKDLVARLAKAYDLTGKNTKANKDFFESVSQVKKETGSLSDAVIKLSGEVKKLSFDDALKSDKAVKLQQKLKDIHDELQNIGKEGSIEDQKSKFKELRDEAVKVENQINNIKDSKIGLNINSKSATAFFQNISKGPEMMNLMGGAAKGLGSTLGSVSKSLGSWPMLVFAAVKAIWDVTKAADQFVKDANEAFATIRGPDIMTPDIKRQFKDFNEQIYNAGENIRVGLDPKEVRGFLESISAAGANITQLNKGLGGYRDAVYVAAKASKTLGTSLPWVGNEIAGLINTFHMNMGEIDKTFVQVAFDAKKSGLSTDRFWTTVKNATASLAFYGITVGGASKILKRFTEDATGSTDDATHAVEGMMGAFKNGSLATHAALLEFAGGAGDTFKKMSDKFKEKKEELEARVDEIVIKQQKGTASSDETKELEKLNAQIADNAAQQENYAQIAKKGPVEQATYMGAAADDAAEIIIKGLTRAYGDISTINSRGIMAAAMSSVDKLGIDAQTMQEIVRSGELAKKFLKKLVISTPKLFSASDAELQANKEQISDAVLATGKGTEDEQAENGQILSDLLVSTIGMSRTNADLFATGIKGDEKMSKHMAELISKGDEASLKELKEMVLSGKFVEKTTVNRMSKQEKTTGEMADAADDTFKQIVDQTLSTNKILDIGRSEVEYRANSLGLFSAISGTTNDILKFLIVKNKDVTFQTQQQKNAEESLKLDAQQNEQLKGLLKTDKETGQITKESQKKMAEQVGQNIGHLTKVKGALNNISQTPENSKGALDSIQTAINAADEAHNKELGTKLEALKTDPEVTAALKDLDDTVAEGDKSPKHALKLAKAQMKYSKIVQQKTKKLIEDNDTALQVQVGMQKNLNEINTSNKTTADIAQLRFKTDPAAQSDVANAIEKGLNSGKTPAEVAKDLNMNLKDMKDSLEAAGRAGSAAKVEAALRAQIMQGLGTGALKVPKPMAKGGIVTKSTLINAGEAGPEAVIPLNKANPAGMGGGSKNITITVNATERDLGQKIADKINTALYNWQLAG